jgi:putative restriction endonuclease
MTARPDIEDALLRAAAFQHVRRLHETHDHLDADHLRAGFSYQGERIPLINPQRGIFKPRRMQFLLSIRTVFPRSGARVWYDDQRLVHRQIYDGEETVDYAFMGDDPEAADNRWLREAADNRIPIIYFLGTSPGRYQAIVPAFIAGWNRSTKSASVAFAAPGVATTSADLIERRYALREVKQRLHQASFRMRSSPPTRVDVPCLDFRSRCCWTLRTSSLTRTRRLVNRLCRTVSRFQRSTMPPLMPT